MLCLANPDLQWHSPFTENKNQTHCDDGLHHQENGYSGMFKRSQEGKNSILFIPPEGVSLMSSTVGH